MFLFRAIPEESRQFREVHPVLPGADLVKHFAEAEDVCLGGARTFRREKTFRAHKRDACVQPGHETDVGQLWHASHEDDIRWLDIAMNQTVLVEMIQGGRQGNPDLDAFAEWKTPPPGGFIFQRLGLIRGRIQRD